MLYAILAYHVEDVVESWSKEEDAALMARLEGVRKALEAAGSLGPAARLGATADAVTLRGPGVVVDGPFAETKERLLGFYTVEVANRDAAVAIATDLNRANPTAVYEIRPIRLYVPGLLLAPGGTDAPAGR